MNSPIPTGKRKRKKSKGTASDMQGGRLIDRRKPKAKDEPPFRHLVQGGGQCQESEPVAASISSRAKNSSGRRAKKAKTPPATSLPDFPSHTNFLAFPEFVRLVRSQEPDANHGRLLGEYEEFSCFIATFLARVDPRILAQEAERISDTEPARALRWKRLAVEWCKAYQPQALKGPAPLPVGGKRGDNPRPRAGKASRSRKRKRRTGISRSDGPAAR